MAGQPVQPTVLVKKSDGTYVRMTLDEMKVYRAQAAVKPVAPIAVPSAPAPVVVEETLPQKIEIVEEKKEMVAKAPPTPPKMVVASAPRPVPVVTAKPVAPAEPLMMYVEQPPAVSAPFSPYAHPLTEEETKKRANVETKSTPAKVSAPSIPPPPRPKVEATPPPPAAAKAMAGEAGGGSVLPVQKPQPKQVMPVQPKQTPKPEEKKLQFTGSKLRDLSAQDTKYKIPDTSADFASPLDDPISPTGGQTSAPPLQGSQADEIIKKLTFKIKPDFVNRLRSTIQLRLRDVRNDSQTKESAMRALDQGGLGLTEAQAEELLTACGEYMGTGKNRKVRRIKSQMPNDKFQTNSKSQISNDFPEPVKPSVSVAQSKEVVVSKPSVASVAPSKPISELVAPSKPVSASVTPGKLVVRDVVMPRPTSMGPVDEVKYFSLTDFRRLSGNPEDAVSRLKQKLYNLRDESYLLYIEALDAWHESPLFVDSMRAMQNALLKKQTLVASMTDKEKITLPEIQALVKMEKEL